VAFAIIATTLTLARFSSGRISVRPAGRLFYEFGLTLAISVTVSAFVA